MLAGLLLTEGFCQVSLRPTSLAYERFRWRVLTHTDGHSQDQPELGKVSVAWSFSRPVGAFFLSSSDRVALVNVSFVDFPSSCFPVLQPSATQSKPQGNGPAFSFGRKIRSATGHLLTLA